MSDMDVSTTEAGTLDAAAPTTVASTSPADTTTVPKEKEHPAQNAERFMYDKEGTMESRRGCLVNNPLFADVKFLVGESRTPIYGHKVMLITASEYFYVLLCGNFAESQMREIPLEKVDPEQFLLLLRYIYAYDVVITFENLPTLWELSSRFMVTDLQDAMRDFLERKLDTKNTLQIIQSNLLYGFPSINKTCLSMISNNPLFFFNNEYFITIDKQILEMIFRCPRINCTDDQLMGALDVWLQHNATTDEDAAALRNMITAGKRTYDCFKLYLFGSRQVVMGESISDFCFTIESSKDLMLYGIGLIVLSNAAVLTFDVKVYEYDEEIGNDQYEYENKHRGVVNVADLFFEELRIVSHAKYRISVDVSPPFQKRAFLMAYPTTHHTSFKMRISGPAAGVYPFGLSYLHCKEGSDNFSDLDSIDLNLN